MMKNITNTLMRQSKTFFHEAINVKTAQACSMQSNNSKVVEIDHDQIIGGKQKQFYKIQGNPFIQQQSIIPQIQQRQNTEFFVNRRRILEEQKSYGTYQTEEMDELWEELKSDAYDKAQKEPLLGSYFFQNVFNHTSFEQCIIYNLANKLGNETINQNNWTKIIEQAFKIDPSLADKIKADLLLVKEKDAAWTSHINTMLYLKGFSGLSLARIAQFLYQNDRKELSYLIQNRTSELFGMDIHPGSKFEGGIFFDHASGLVIGETATIGSGTVILHNVTLGASGKEAHGSDRHPKIGRNCYIGSNVSVLGNIQIGNQVKIGAGTICLKPVPDNKTCVGVPAKILG